jgi:hypothetical protein
MYHINQIACTIKVNYPIHAADPYMLANKNPRAPKMSPVNTRVISNNHHSYWITTTHLGWFCGRLYLQPTGAHRGFAPAPFEKSQLIQFLSKKRKFQFHLFSNLSFIMLEKKLKNFITARYVHPLHWRVWDSSPYFFFLSLAMMLQQNLLQSSIGWLWNSSLVDLQARLTSKCNKLISIALRICSNELEHHP